MGGGTIQKGNLARLLVGNWECVLEATVAIPELITPPLLRLDTLATNFLATAVMSKLEPVMIFKTDA